ncbi:MAG: O-antigen ligase family protein, partial [Acidimicrobiia bacterium]|nr:O-antigen ligase family protein [Acidimicrobiia bacterium]
QRPRTAAILSGFLAFAAMTTASRAAVLGLIAVAVYAVWHHRWIKGIAVAMTLVISVAAGALFTDAMSRDVESVARLGSDSGVAVRLDLWTTAATAAQDKPIVGWGPGLFRDAVTPIRALEDVTAQASGAQWVDAHNVPVEFGVTTGLLGLALLAAWLGMSGWRARGPLAVFALIALGVHLLQPMSLVLSTTALLALGASSLRSPDPGPTWKSVGLAVPAVMCAVALVVGAAYLDRGEVDFDIGAAETAARILPMYPDPAVAASRAHALRAIDTRDPMAMEDAIAWRHEAIDRDPTNAFLWQGLGELQLSELNWAAAGAAYTEALEHDPWLRGAHIGLVRVAIGIGDGTDAGPHLQVIEDLGLEEIAADLRLQLETAAG